MMKGAHFKPNFNKMEEVDIQELGIDAVKWTIKAKLGLDVLQGVSLKEMDRRLQGHDDCALNAYLVWLLDQLNGWDFTDFAAYQPQIQSFCDRLRKRQFADQRILDSFRLWKSAQIELDTSLERRLLLVEGLLCQFLSFQKPKPPSLPRFYHRAGKSLDQSHKKHGQPANNLLHKDNFPENRYLNRANTVGMKNKEVITISSGDEGPDVEISGLKVANDKHDQVKQRMEKPTSQNSAPDKGDHTSYLGAYNEDHRGSQARETRGRKDKTKKQGKDQKDTYICKRCGKPGKGSILSKRPNPSYRSILTTHRARFEGLPYKS